MTPSRSAYLVGGGVGALAAAAFLVRDGHVPGEQITIFEQGATLGGSLDAAGDAEHGYTMRGGRMLTTANYECTWGLFKSIPSLDDPTRSVFDETVAFNERIRAHSRARLVDRRRARTPVTSMGFSMRDRVELLKLTNATEEALGSSRITDWLSPGFFATEFWFMWATTFAFQPWHSAVELRRYLHRFMMEFSRIDTLGGVKRTVFNQYDSLVLPLQTWLAARGVRFCPGHRVTDLTVEDAPDGSFAVTAIHVTHRGLDRVVPVPPGDLVLVQNASMTDASSFGSMSRAPEKLTKSDSGGWALWERLAKGRPDLGRPAVFKGSVAESAWQSFTVTLKTPAFFDAMQELTGNEAGTGGLVTFKDSAWLASVVLAHQPHFRGQPEGVQVFWGYALFPDRVGDYVPKAMVDCSGDDLLTELAGHLRFDRSLLDTATCIPCRMPYITSMFAPRSPGDRPLPVPRGSVNLAFISQFVEIADDVVFTVEYSVRGAQMAVRELLGRGPNAAVLPPVPPVTPHDHELRVQLDALAKALA